MKRRHFVLSALGVAGALGVGWALLAPRQRLSTREPLALAPGQVALNGWLAVGADGRIGIVMPRSEMGQGVHTGLAMLLADELDADWSRVAILPAPIDPIYFNQAVAADGLPFHPDSQGWVKQMAGHLTAKTMREIGVMVTGGSSSIKDLWLPMRQAGASARAMLVAAAAQRLNLPAAELTVAAGVVSHPSGKSATFGELAEAAAKLPLPDGVSLKAPAQWKLIGKPLPRIEAAAKGLGTAGFGGDATPPGLLYASVVMCPTLGGQVARVDSTAAGALPGVKQVVMFPGYAGGTAGVAAIADTPWHAMQALKKTVVTWDEASSPAAGFSSAAFMDQLAKTLDGDEGFGYFKTGDVDAALKTAAKTISAEYRAPFLAHATMEPQTCTAQVKDGRATVWAPTQIPDVARSAVAQALGLKADQVQVNVTLLGGGFGRRLDVDFIAQAAVIAQLGGGGAPVQTIWSREEDMRHDFYRPAAVSRFSAGLDAQGKLLAWKNVSAGPSPTQGSLSRLFGLPKVGPDKTSSEGAFDQPYGWPAARVGHVIVDSPVPVGFWRSVGHSHQAFFKESFVDEAAHAAGQDPVAFRAALLAQHPRALAVLQAAAALAGWGQPVPAAPDGAKAARGIALHRSFGSIVAQVARVSLDADKAIRVHQVHCVVDCGTAVNPNLIRQQMESAIVYGLSAALFGRIDVDNGRVLQSNFHDYPALRMNQCPAIQTEIIASTEPPEGVGEPGTPPIAPAVANAVFALTGQRLRALPLRVS
jgi:isoquinoline 1-oxidoreductase subunit beta